MLSCAGSAGGVVEALCLQPIDVIKTRLQLDNVGKYNGQLAFTEARLCMLTRMLVQC